jgi:hypothetical protein
MKKMAIIVTDQQAAAIERIRRQQGVTRSQVIQQALDLFLASCDVTEEADAAYGSAYRKRPEPAEEAEAYERLSREVLAPEERG